LKHTESAAAFVAKNDSNYEMQIGIHFPYQHCSELERPDAIELIAEAWLACKPLVDQLRNKRA
jgi:hypothetical protein